MAALINRVFRWPAATQPIDKAMGLLGLKVAVSQHSTEMVLVLVLVLVLGRITQSRNSLGRTTLRESVYSRNAGLLVLPWTSQRRNTQHSTVPLPMVLGRIRQSRNSLRTTTLRQSVYSRNAGFAGTNGGYRLLQVS